MIFDKIFKNRKTERRSTLLEVIDNQLHDNDPEGIVEVYDHFKERGFSDLEIRQMFAAVFEGEIHKLNSGINKEFDREFYLNALKAIK